MEVSVTEIELDNGISAGIHLRVAGPDGIPTFEEHSARLDRGIRLDDWAAMTVEEKAIIIAQRRIQRAMENIQADAEIKRSKRKMKGKGPRA